ncbi:hypothetical protein N9W34_02940 [Rickettsiales bacterium]|nr:hypothetical protein [Rickettsiales bacterium]
MRFNIAVLFFLSFIFCVNFADYSSASSNSGKIDKHNTSLPIEITADDLSVRPNKDIAIFTGNVEAKQGKLLVNADEMTVFYSKKKKSKSKVKKGNDAAIDRIVTKGNVSFKTPKEVVRGDRGVLDVVKNIIVIEGNVAVSTGNHVVRGQQLVYNLLTGQASMGNSETQEGKKKRVRGVFIPSK